MPLAARLLLASGVLAIVAGCAGDAVRPPPRPAAYVDVAAVAKTGTVDAGAGVASAGQPGAAALEAFAAAGYVAVIDLRGAGEDRGFDEPAVVERLGLEYLSLPVPSPAAVTFENAEKLDRLLAGIDGPVLVHCASGNRVGALLALRESLNGADAEQAVAYGRQAGLTRLESVVRQRLEDGKTTGQAP